MNTQKHCTFVMIENSIETRPNWINLGPKVNPYILYTKPAQYFFLVFVWKYKIINAKKYWIFDLSKILILN